MDRVSKGDRWFLCIWLDVSNIVHCKVNTQTLRYVKDLNENVIGLCVHVDLYVAPPPVCQ